MSGPVFYDEEDEVEKEQNTEEPVEDVQKEIPFFTTGLFAKPEYDKYRLSLARFSAKRGDYAFVSKILRNLEKTYPWILARLSLDTLPSILGYFFRANF